MIDMYDKLIEEKEEIESMFQLINETNIFSTENLKIKLRELIKYTLFFKRIYEFNEQGHYSKCMISDLLFLINSLSQNSIKVFYTLYRSFIENFIRFTLELKDNDDTGVRNLFTLYKNKYYVDETKDIIDFIEGEYGKCCDFVHSNIKANQKIFEYYNELINEDEFKVEDVIRLCSVILTFLKKSSLLLVYIKIEWIDEAFYKKKQLLKFLMSDCIYDCFEKKLEDI